MTTLKLYSIPVSNFGRAVQMLLEEKGVAYDFVMAKPQSPEVKAIHPFGKIPVLEHDGMQLCESEAIARYIDGYFDGPKFFPDSAKERALVDQWVSLVNTIIDPILIRRYVLGYVLPKMNGQAPDMEAIQACVPQIQDCFDVLEGALGGKYLVGSEVSYADFVLYATLHYMPAFPETAELLPRYPNIQAYLGHMSSRESAQKTTPPEV